MLFGFDFGGACLNIERATVFGALPVTLELLRVVTGEETGE